MPAVPPHVLERLRLKKQLSEKEKRQYLNAIPSRAHSAILRAMRDEIVLKAKSLGIPAGRLNEHFEWIIGKGMPMMAAGERMIRDLQETEELKESTGVEKKLFEKFLEHKSLAAALEEMKKHAQAMGQMPRQ